MTVRTFVKTLSANDVGATGAHMAGILVPKRDGDLLAFLPSLDARELNPSAWIGCLTPDDTPLRLRFVYYNNRLHVSTGTRNEYRITHLTKFLREAGAREGDIFEISREDGQDLYRIRVIRIPHAQSEMDDQGPLRIRLTSAWRRVH